MEVRNTNRLLGTFPGVLGLKTGDTANAGEVLLSYATLAHEDFLGVVMGSPDHMAETAGLLAYAGRILGPQDHFYAAGAHLDELADWPAWRRARLGVAGPLDDGKRPGEPAPLSPAQRELAAALRDLLPGLLGGRRHAVTGGAGPAGVMTEVVSATAIAARIAEMGAALAADYAGKEPVLLGVLKGAVPFLADLGRRLPPNLDIDFLSLTRFGSEGRVGISMDSATSIAGRRVVLVEDIVDTGLTLSYLLGLLETHEPASLATATLLDKRTRRIVDVPLRYRGFEVGDEFLLGYGLDWEGRYRNLPGLWAVLDLAAFRLDPEAATRGAFGGAGDQPRT